MQLLVALYINILWSFCWAKKMKRCVTFVHKKGFMVNFYGWGSTASRLEWVYFKEPIYILPLSYWYSLYWPRMEERLRRSRSHTMVVIMGPLDWESNTLTSTTQSLKLSVKININVYLLLISFVDSYVE